MPQILMDPESKSLVEEFRPGQGAVQEPSRYPETCVAPVASEQEACATAELAHNFHRNLPRDSASIT